jgi:hypothetical protein
LQFVSWSHLLKKVAQNAVKMAGQLMKGPERVAGVSLAKELTSLAEFRLQAAEKLRVIEKLLSGSRSVSIGPTCTNCATDCCGVDHDPEITRSCLQLLVASESPLTIGQICDEVQAKLKFNEIADDPLHVVYESLHQLSSLELIVPVEQRGIRKWAWTGSESVMCANKGLTLDAAAD